MHKQKAILLHGSITRLKFMKRKIYHLGTGKVLNQQPECPDVLIHNAADSDVSRKGSVVIDGRPETIRVDNHAGPILLTNSLINLMKQVSLIIITVLIIAQPAVMAQQGADTITLKPIISKEVIKKSILPLSLITLGAALSKSKFEKNIKDRIRGNIIDDFALPIDDQMQYVPIAEIYISDLLGVKAKNHWFDQTKYLIISNIITAGITHAGKSIINKQRPNGSDHSFPSGHSSFSFTNATVLYEEFHDSAPVFAYSGYFLTSTVGSLRVINNKHWLSDVLAGAGLGILVTKLVYHFEPLKNWNPVKKSKNITFIPEISDSMLAFNFKYRF